MSDDSPDARLVTLRHAATEVEAESIRLVLDDAGVESWAFGAPIAMLGFSASANALGGIPVQVRLRDLDRAKQVLRDNSLSSASLDWDSVDVGEDDDEVRAVADTDPLVIASGRLFVRVGAVLAVVLLAVTVLAAVGAVAGLFTPRS